MKMEFKATIENWSLCEFGNGDDYAAPELKVHVICGRAYGYPDTRDGEPIRTSRVKDLNLDEMYVQTQNSIYKLGSPDSKWLDWLFKNKFKSADKIVQQAVIMASEQKLKESIEAEKKPWTPPPTPFVAVDMIIKHSGHGVLEPGQTHHVLMIERKFPPLGLAFPGGFMDIGETCEHAATRETREETGLIIYEENWKLFGVHSKPDRDPRAHIISVIYEAYYLHHKMDARAGDDAKKLRWVSLDELPHMLEADQIASIGHKRIALNLIGQIGMLERG